MAKQIRANELFEKEDIFEGIRRSAEKTMVTLEKVDKEFKDLGETLKKSLGKASFGGSKELKEFLAMVEKANNLQTQAVKIEKEKAIAEQQAERLKREKLKTQTAENREQERQNKQKQRALKLAKDEQNAYKKLVKSTRDLKNESKRLGAELIALEQSGKKNTSQYRKLESQYKRVTKSAQAGDVQLKKLDKTVGDNFRNVGNYTGALNTLKNGLMQLGVAFGTAQIVRNVAGIIVDFDQAQADLSAISGKTTEELAGLTQQAKDLGATTQFSATQITEMQIELAKLGFTTEQITASTEAVSNFASATGSDMAEASKLAGATLRGFGLEADEMERVVSVLGVATTKSALSFESLNTSMSTISPVANAFGFSVEDTTALLGQLANAGFDASSSATATRNILLNLADANGDLAKELGRPIKSADDLAEGLKELQAKGIDLATALELTDKRSVAAFETFLKGSDTLIEFRDSITDVNDELSAMAEKRLDSVKGQLTLLSSAWEGFVLGIGDATNSSNIFKDVIGFVARNLNTIMTVLGKVIKGFVLYKSTMVALNGVNFLVNGGFQKMLFNIGKLIPGTRAYRLEQIQLARAGNQVATATNRMGKAMKNVPYLLIIGLAIDFAMALWDGANASAELQRQEEKRAEQERKNKADALEFSKLVKDGFDERIELLEQEMELEKALAKNKNKQGSLDVKLAKQKLSLIDETIKSLERSIAFDEKQVQREIDSIDRQIRSGIIQNKNYNIEEDANIKRLRTSQAQAKIDIESFNKLKEQFKLQKDIVEAQGDDDKTKKAKSFNTELKDTNEYLSKQLSLVQQLAQIEQERDLLRQQKGIDQEFQNQIDLLEKTGEFDATRLNDLIREKTSSEVAYLEQRKLNQIQAIDEQYNYEKNKRQEALIDERDKLLAQKDITSTARDKINADFKIKQDELNAQEIDRWFDKELEKEVIASQTTKNIEELRNKELETIDEYHKDFLDKEKEFNEKLLELDKQRQQETREFVKATADYFIKKSNEKIAQIEKEIQASQKQYDTLKKLAEEGNIDAKESLAEQQRIIAEANRKKEQEQKRQQRIKLAESVYSTYSQKVESGSKNPLAETIRDTTLLNQFISSLPTFEDGTDDTGKNGRGIDGKGGFLSVLHPNERVVPKSLNAQIGGLTNEELSRIANEYNNGKIVRSDSQLGSALELSLLVGKLDNLTKVIQDKPETNIELGEITQGAMEIVKSTKEGNTYTYNRYKVK